MADKVVLPKGHEWIGRQCLYCDRKWEEGDEVALSYNLKPVFCWPCLVEQFMPEEDDVTQEGRGPEAQAGESPGPQGDSGATAQDAG